MNEFNTCNNKVNSLQKPVKVLMVLSSVEINGGVQNKVMDIYRNVDREKLQFDFYVYTDSELTLESEINKLGGKVYFHGKLREIGALKFYHNLYLLIKEGGYNVVHSYSGINDGIILFLAKLAKVEIRISHSRGASIDNKIKRFFSPILKRLILKNSTKLLACSYQAGKFLYGNNNYEVIPNPINTERFMEEDFISEERLKKKFDISANTLTLGHIGRFTQEKNHEFLLKICLILKKENINFKMILVGDGELKTEIKNRVIEMGIEKYVVFESSQKEIHKYYHILDILLLPSFHEGFGNVAVEAQVAKKRVLASTGVSKQVDLGIGLVEFIELDKIYDWINVIKMEGFYTSNISNVDIENVIKSFGYNIESVVEQHYKVYNIETT